MNRLPKDLPPITASMSESLDWLVDLPEAEYRAWALATLRAMGHERQRQGKNNSFAVVHGRLVEIAGLFE